MRGKGCSNARLSLGCSNALEAYHLQLRAQAAESSSRPNFVTELKIKQRGLEKSTLFCIASLLV
jgi:hypothetical protein